MRQLTLTVLMLLAFVSTSVAKEIQIKIVGSSTVYPFTTVVAERFGKETKHATPVVESTGTGGGMKLFCSGIDTNTPSATNASRAIKDKEAKLCANNNVNFIEIAVGNDGIAFANSTEGVKVNFTREQLWMALADLGPRPNKWSEIDPSLPDQEIIVMVPPPTSGTRDAWNSLVMKKGCPKEILEAQGKKACYNLREDGPVVEAGENDTLLIQKLQNDPKYFAIFGYSYLDNSRDKVQAMTIDGVEISLESIQDYSYPISRPLFVYFKKEHFDIVPGLKKFMQSYVSKKAIGKRGYLLDLGLVPLDAETMAEMRTRTK
jgi:phosphate transport system substrate-binding protein